MNWTACKLLALKWFSLIFRHNRAFISMLPVHECIRFPFHRPSLLSPVHRSCMQGVHLSCRSTSGRTLWVFYRAVSAVTSRPPGVSAAPPLISVTLSSECAWRSTRFGWRPLAPAPSARAARPSWAETRTPYGTTDTRAQREAGSTFPSNTPGRSVHLLMTHGLINMLLISSQLFNFWPHGGAVGSTLASHLQG